MSCSYSVPELDRPQGKLEKDTIKNISTSETSSEICTVDSIIWTPGGAETILLNPLQDVFPGAVFDAQSFQTGKYLLLDDKKRKLLTISIRGPIFKNSSIAKDVYPVGAEIDEAINTILKDSVVGDPPAQITINASEMFEEKQISQMFKGSYSGGVTKVEAGFNFSDHTIKSRYILDVTQIFYEVNVDNPGRNGFFKSAPFGISKYNPVYVSQVKYGRKIMISVESKTNISGRGAELRSEFGAFAKAKAYGKLVDSNFARNNNVGVLIMGGAADDGFKVFTSVSNMDSLYKAISKGATWSLKNQGTPLAYTLKKTSNGETFSINLTGKYVARKCVIKPTNEFVISGIVLGRYCPSVFGGKDREFAGDPNFTSSVRIFAEGNKIKAEIYGLWTENDGNTSGAIPHFIEEIGSVPDSLDVLDINSYKTFNYPSTTIPGYGPYLLPLNGNETNSCVRSMSVIGDSAESDDMFPNCIDDAVHTKIQRIEFFPIRLSVTKKVKKPIVN